MTVSQKILGIWSSWKFIDFTFSYDNLNKTMKYDLPIVIVTVAMDTLWSQGDEFNQPEMVVMGFKGRAHVTKETNQANRKSPWQQ